MITPPERMEFTTFPSLKILLQCFNLYTLFKKIHFDQNEFKLITPSEYIDKYFKYLEFERKLSINTIKSYFNDLKDFDFFFKGDLLKLKYDDLKKYIKENKEAEKERQIEDEYLFKCLDKVVEASKFEIPAEMTEDEVNRLVREFSEKLQYQGLKLEDYLKFCNSNFNNSR